MLASLMKTRFSDLNILHIAAAFLEDRLHFPFNDTEKLAGLFGHDFFTL